MDSPANDVPAGLPLTKSYLNVSAFSLATMAAPVRMPSSPILIGFWATVCVFLSGLEGVNLAAASVEASVNLAKATLALLSDWIAPTAGGRQTA